jgi:hypothetical protein
MAETQIGNAIKNVLDSSLDSNLSIGQTGVSAKDGIKLLKNLAKDVMTQIKDNNYQADGRTKITLFKTGKSLKETDSQKFGLKHIGDVSQPYELGDFGKRLNSIDDTINMRKTINDILIRYKDQIGEDYDTYLQFSSPPASYTIDNKINIDKKSVFAGQERQLNADTKSYDTKLKAEQKKKMDEKTKYDDVINTINDINSYETAIKYSKLNLKELEEELKIYTKTNEELDEKIKPLTEEINKKSSLEKQKDALENIINLYTNAEKKKEKDKYLGYIKNVSEIETKLQDINDKEKEEKELKNKKIKISTIEGKINNKKTELKNAKVEKDAKINELKTLLITNENILKFIFIAIGKELNEADKMSSLEDNINEIIKPETLTKIENKKRSLK